MGATLGSSKVDGSGQTTATSQLIYREDEAHFKRRLDSSIQFSWVYNSAATILICVLIFYFLGQPIFIGILVALLILLVSNIQLTLSRVGRASRWKVYTNSVEIPSGSRGKPLTVQFTDIGSVERQKGISGERLRLRLIDGGVLTFHTAGQDRPLAALEHAFGQYKRVRYGQTRRSTEHEGSMNTVEDTPKMP